jgi:hypothetical protein
VSGAVIRKLIVVVEETCREMEQDIAPATRKAAAIAVIRNSFAGRYAEDLEPLMAMGEELGGLLGERAVAALGVPLGAVESYGKAAIVGERGELKHAAAILHPAPGRAAAQGGGEGRCAGAVGEEDGWRRHADRRAARAQGRRLRAQPLRRHGGAGGGRDGGDEIVVAVVVTDSGRPLPCVGGLSKDQIKGEDGLR